MEEFDRSRQALGICLATLAGYVDALGFLAGDSYFVSFMSGNTTRLAVDLSENWATAIFPALLIAGFISGVTAGSMLASLAGPWRKPAILGLVSILLMAAAGFQTIGQIHSTLGALVFAMGAINNTLQKDETPIGLTYMTGALVRLGQGLASLLMGKRRKGSLLYGLLWLGLAGGAVVGALAHELIGAGALWIAAMAAWAMTLMAWKIARPKSSA